MSSDPKEKDENELTLKPESMNRYISKGGVPEKGWAEIKIIRSIPNMDKVTLTLDDREFLTATSDINGLVTVTTKKVKDIQFTGDATEKGSEAEKIESAYLEREGTSWRDEGESVVFTHPGTSESVRLFKADARTGTSIPKNIPPVYGQPGMLFNVAMAIYYEQLYIDGKGSEGAKSILSGPTGTGKTTVYQFIAQLLNWDFTRIQIDPKTEGASLIGEYLPAGVGTFEWCDGPVSEAARMSNHHPHIAVMDELSRIGNVAELSRMYSLWDDTRKLYIPERKHEMADGKAETITPGHLYWGATMNPADDDNADYVGVRNLDPALMSRFAYAPKIAYPNPEIEVMTLRQRVKGLSLGDAERMVRIGNAIRQAADISYPFSFRELVAWGQALPYLGFQEAATVSFVTKAHPSFQQSIINKLNMQ